jgi:hypothetical protein
VEPHFPLTDKSGSSLSEPILRHHATEVFSQYINRPVALKLRSVISSICNGGIKDRLDPLLLDFTIAGPTYESPPLEGEILQCAAELINSSQSHTNLSKADSLPEAPNSHPILTTIIAAFTCLLRARTLEVLFSAARDSGMTIGDAVSGSGSAQPLRNTYQLLRVQSHAVARSLEVFLEGFDRLLWSKTSDSFVLILLLSFFILIARPFTSFEDEMGKQILEDGNVAQETVYALMRRLYGYLFQSSTATKIIYKSDIPYIGRGKHIDGVFWQLLRQSETLNVDIFTLLKSGLGLDPLPPLRATSPLPDAQILQKPAVPLVGQNRLLEWEKHRSMISQLYINENRTLKDTMKIMMQNYGFVAR